MLRNFVQLQAPDSWDDPIFTRFLKGVYNLRTPKPKHTFTWDVSQVLTYLEQFYPNNLITLKEITLKTCMLIALSSGHRAQSIHALNLDNCTDQHNSMSFTFSELLKNSKPGVGNVLHIHRYNDNDNLCVYLALQSYIQRTASFRKSNKLWLSFNKPHLPVTRQSISRWLKTTLQAAGIDTSIFQGHSTRMASTSKAAAVGLNIDVIIQTAGWSAATNFKKFYYRNTTPNTAMTQGSIAFQTAVLKQHKV